MLLTTDLFIYLLRKQVKGVNNLLYIWLTKNFFLETKVKIIINNNEAFISRY